LVVKKPKEFLLQHYRAKKKKVGINHGVKYSGTSLKRIPELSKPLNYGQKISVPTGPPQHILPLKKVNLCITSKKCGP